MGTTQIEKNKQQFSDRLDGLDQFPSRPAPPEPIYDLTKTDKTELVKAAGPIERGENP